jgi:hypothetical protein
MNVDLRIVWGVGLVGAIPGCGIAADLGNDEGRPQAGGGDAGVVDEWTLPPGTVVMDVPGVEAGVNELAVDSEYLYFVPAEPVNTGGGRLLRCEKTNCGATTVEIHRVPSENGRIGALSVIGDQIGMLEYFTHAEDSLTTCVAPDCRDLVEIDGLLPNVNKPSFEPGAVEWGQRDDDAVYRCSVPGCRSGPELIVQGIGADRVFHSGDVRILVEANFVWRLVEAPEAPEVLALGPESRSLGFPGFDDRLFDYSTLGPPLVAIEGDWLYAAFEGDCQELAYYGCSIGRWPLRGYGPREIVFASDEEILAMDLSDGELTLLLRGSGLAFQTATCRVEDCAGTLRRLADGEQAFAFDSERVFWARGPRNPTESPAIEAFPRIYSAPRLPVP